MKKVYNIKGKIIYFSGANYIHPLAMMNEESQWDAFSLGMGSCLTRNEKGPASKIVGDENHFHFRAIAFLSMMMVMAQLGELLGRKSVIL